MAVLYVDNYIPTYICKKLIEYMTNFISNMAKTIFNEYICYIYTDKCHPESYLMK